jgi:hypothetical protein
MSVALLNGVRVRVVCVFIVVVAEGGCGGLGCWMDVVSLYNSFPRGQVNRMFATANLYPGASTLGKTEHTPPPHTFYMFNSAIWSQMHEPAYARQQHAISLASQSGYVFAFGLVSRAGLQLCADFGVSKQ